MAAKILHPNGQLRENRMAMLTAQKIDSNSKTITGDKERHYIIIKELIYQWNITIVSICTLNIKTPKHIRRDL